MAQAFGKVNTSALPEAVLPQGNQFVGGPGRDFVQVGPEHRPGVARVDLRHRAGQDDVGEGGLSGDSEVGQVLQPHSHVLRGAGAREVPASARSPAVGVPVW
jgi:hypothetical protein